MAWDDKGFREELDRLGEREVRAILARGDQWANLENRRNTANDWLRAKEEERSSAAAARKEVREEESLSISRRALANSERATRISIIAILLSGVVAIVEVIKWLSK
ncbi:MAG: hypothetical protein HY525_20225 [Betaproteobacteria bacterium]|nr:hypothetical protein [Betaproteobacteria bacterium]